MALEAIDQGVYGEGPDVEGRKADVMHPTSYLARTGFDHGSIGLSPAMYLSDRYMWGYTRGRAIWDAWVSVHSG